MTASLGLHGLAHGAIGLPAALSLFDQGDNGGNHIFEFRDLADHGRRGRGS